eukprot:CAMPEP_0177748626 /NCGR_PEP_ID=MMETSP0484_2-20121128/32037_1 /TAXON_ID=354590 /ORGANISM="Rhodomonas lens, Strain RHODO" /LENGTH=81 /DNA_ID=CAMNT_0019263523 /DNA_START=412 /DNA_END=654 /DNA_ORIENTATION=+
MSMRHVTPPAQHVSSPRRTRPWTHSLSLPSAVCTPPGVCWALLRQCTAASCRSSTSSAWKLSHSFSNKRRAITPSPTTSSP